eukprot:COSAG03_NODE_20513_length_318_cov_0.474886_1_plen_57_part_10
MAAATFSTMYRNSTPDLCTLAAGSCPRTRLPSGQVELSGSSSEIYSLHSSTLKEIHI